MIDLAAELGLKVQPILDETNEALWLRQMDRWGDLLIADRCHMEDEPAAVQTHEVYYYEPKVRRRVRFTAALR